MNKHISRGKPQTQPLSETVELSRSWQLPGRKDFRYKMARVQIPPLLIHLSSIQQIFLESTLVPHAKTELVMGIHQ